MDLVGFVDQPLLLAAEGRDHVVVRLRRRAELCAVREDGARTGRVLPRLLG